eukprot:1159187-Pelagomonas_calceolata.AAC.1
MVSLAPEHPPLANVAQSRMLTLARVPSQAPAQTQFQPLLPVQSPVPSDIAIAQSIAPKHISKIAEQLGLQADEYDLYGATKAKVGEGKESSTRCQDVSSTIWRAGRVQPCTTAVRSTTSLTDSPGYAVF